MTVHRTPSAAGPGASAPAAARSPGGGSFSSPSCGSTRAVSWKSQVALLAQASAFNAANPIGTRGFLLRDKGVVAPTTVIGHAQLIGGDAVVARFDGVNGFFSIDRFVKDAP